MILYHTSPEKIEKINKNRGPFSGALFFSDSPYYMSTASKNVYTVNVEDSDFIDLYDLDNDAEIIEDIKHMFNALFDQDINDDDAYDYLVEDIDIFSQDLDGELSSEFSWFLQGIQAKAAKKQGYLGVLSDDEQGAVWIINMINKEHLLNDISNTAGDTNE